MPPEQQTVPITQMPVSSAPQTQVSQIGYAGFWLRFLALALDTLIITVIIAIPIKIIIVIAGISLGEDPAHLSTGFTFFETGLGLLQIALSYFYFIVLTNRNQATIGKRLLGLRVVAEGGAPLSVGKIAFRETIGKLISALILFIGYLMAAFTGKKQALHDKMVGSVVISNPAERKTWAFVTSIVLVVLYFLLVVIAILGILASVTLVSLNVARNKTIDVTVKSDLSNIRTQAEYIYYSTGNNSGFSKVCEDPTVTQTMAHAESFVKEKGTCNANRTAYATYFPLKNPTAPYAGFCVDSTGAARESGDLGSSTVCP